MIIEYNDLKHKLKSILIRNDFTETNAELLSQILTDNTLVGVASHGVNRFSAIVSLVKSGHIIPNAEPVLVNSFGSWEQWDAQYGPGPLNAWRATERVIELSRANGVGAVTLKNSNHWMRPGAFGWKAADAGHILICWTNAIPMMPPWESREPKLGNNPITLAVPRSKGNVVIDMALSQYSYGKLSTYRRAGKELEYPGGYDKEGNLTTDAAVIYEEHSVLPIGFWKGAGLAMLFDLIAAVLSGGRSTNELGKDMIDTGMSQVFISFDPSKSYSGEAIDKIADEVVDSVKSASPANAEAEVSYPGERILKMKEKNLREGITINNEIWGKIESL